MSCLGTGLEPCGDCPRCWRAAAVIHLTTSAAEPSSATRLAVCFRALGSTGPSAIGEQSLPVERGTKNRHDVTCPDCLAATADVPVYRVFAERDGHAAVVGEFVDFEPAGNLAKAYRADGYKAKVKQPAVTP